MTGRTRGIQKRCRACGTVYRWYQERNLVQDLCPGCVVRRDEASPSEEGQTRLRKFWGLFGVGKIK